MVDKAIRMECKDCHITFSTTDFYDHVIDDLSSTCRHKSQLTMTSMHGLPRGTTSASGMRVEQPHNRTISSIRGNGLRGQAMRGSANQLFNPASAYAAYAQQTQSTRHLRQNLTQSSAGIYGMMNASMFNT